PSSPHPPPGSFFLSPAPATPAIYTLSLHDALPIYTASQSALRKISRSRRASALSFAALAPKQSRKVIQQRLRSWIKTTNIWANRDRKSTRLNSSHVSISYAVFCLQKKNQVVVDAAV